MIRVFCGCGRVFKADIRHSGRRTRCPACGANLTIGQAPSSGSGEVYQVADAQTMRSMLKEAIIKRIGFIYVTDGKRPNPWSRLPADWEDEVNTVTRLQ
jgi:hypothetical protein